VDRPCSREKYKGVKGQEDCGGGTISGGEARAIKGTSTRKPPRGERGSHSSRKRKGYKMTKVPPEQKGALWGGEPFHLGGRVTHLYQREGRKECSHHIFRVIMTGRTVLPGEENLAAAGGKWRGGGKYLANVQQNGGGGRKNCSSLEGEKQTVHKPKRGGGKSTLTHTLYICKIEWEKGVSGLSTALVEKEENKKRGYRNFGAPTGEEGGKF